jgi:RecJ-like exonuclease
MKKCFKCGQSKDRSEFYPHKQMRDGLLGKCKECTKKDIAERIEVKKKDPEWMKKERERCRVKQERYRIEGVAKCSPGAQKRHQAKYPEKYKARTMAANAKRRGVIQIKHHCEHCNTSGVRIQMHHPDYSKPLHVIFLCTKCHGKEHWIDKE